MSTTPSIPELRRDAQGYEVRHMAGLPALEVRAVGDGEDIPFEGYAATFNVRSSVIWGEFVEVVAPGAFASALGRDDVRFTINHDVNQVLARFRRQASDTMTLTEDSVGLHVSARMAPTAYARDLATVVRRGDVDGMSFRFKVLQDRWTVIQGGDLNGLMERTLLDVELIDVSVVTHPAYPETSASVRSAGGVAELATALGLDELDEERRAAALAVIARGGEPAEVLAEVRAITTAPRAPASTPNRDRVQRWNRALGIARRLPATTV